MKHFNWKHLTKGKGDSGMTRLLFGSDIRKSSQVFEVLSCFDCCNASLARLSTACRDGDSPFPRQWLDILGDSMIPLGGLLACDPSKVDRYHEKYGDPLPEDRTRKLRALFDEITSALNEGDFSSGWLAYHRMQTPLEAAIADTTTLLRSLEITAWQYIETMPDAFQPAFRRIMPWWNLNSKVGYTINVYLRTDVERPS